MNGIMPNQLPRRTLPSDVLIQKQQPKRPTSGAMSTYIQQLEEPLMSVTSERTQTSPPTGAQQQRCSPSYTSVETHPVQRSLPGSGVSTHTPQSQGPLSNDALPLRRLQGSLPTAVFENCQPMQRNTYPQFLPTHRAAPCDVSQAARIPVASAKCTQLQQPQVYLPGSRQGASQCDLLIQNNNNVQSFQPDAAFQQNRDAQTYVSGTVSTQIQDQMPLLGNVHPEERSTQGPHSEIYPSKYVFPEC